MAKSIYSSTKTKNSAFWIVNDVIQHHI